MSMSKLCGASLLLEADLGVLLLEERARKPSLWKWILGVDCSILLGEDPEPEEDVVEELVRGEIEH